MQTLSCRQKAAQVIEFNNKSTRLGYWLDGFLIVLIISNILAIILESVPSIEARYQSHFYLFEIFSVAVFSIEYLVRVWSCPDLKEDDYSDNLTGRVSYMLSLPALIDLIAILPFYLSLFIGIDLRFLRVFRLLRVFKLTRYSSAMGTLLKVLKDESSAFFAAFFILLVVLILASSGIYLIEHEVQPDAFGSIPAAMWWAMATLTTVGYGDVTPITPLGKLFGGLITVVGMGMVALPAGILASGFSSQLKRNRSIYNYRLAQLMNDGVLTADEKIELDDLRQELGISDRDADLLFSAYKHQLTKHYHHCPHCKKPLKND